jgi:hypothetical protein
MEQITSSTPGLYWLGTLDKSGGVVSLDDSPLPFTRPIMFGFAPMGKEGPAWMSTSEIVASYGDAVIDFDSKYATHAMTYISRAVKSITRGIFWRLRAKDAAPEATMAFDFEMVKDNIPEYKRDATGNYLRDDAGALQPTGETFVGYRIAFFKSAIPVDDQGVSTYGKRQPTKGVLTSSIAGEESTRYPLADYVVADFGSEGNNLGLSMWAPTTSSAITANPDLNEEVNSFINRLKIVRRPSVFEAPATIPNKYDQVSTTFSFGEAIVSENDGGIVLDLDARVPGEWTDDSAEYYQRSQIGKMNLYREYLIPALKAIQATEAPHGLIGDGDDDYLQVNLLGATDVNDIPYYTLQLEGLTTGSIMFTENSTFYFEGGSDGTMSNAVLDTLVKEIFDNFDQPGYRLDNVAKYPFNFFCDSGYSLNTKYSLMNMLTKRQDSFLILSTQDISRAANDEESEESIAASILTRLQMFPDSVEYATPPFRGALVGHVGLLAGTARNVPATLSIDLAYKLMRYGAGDSGVLNSDYAPDTSDNGNYIVTEVKGLNVIDKTWRNKRRLWAQSVVYVEDYDHNNRLFYPGIQSFYNDQTSVLNSAIVGLCVAQLARYAWETWRNLTGNQKLKDVQLIERSDESIKNRAAGSFDDRMDVIPHSQLTRADGQRGYSWTCPIDIGANGMHTVMSAYVVAYRREDLNGQ